MSDLREMVVRLSPVDHAALKQRADAEDRSMASVMRIALRHIAVPSDAVRKVLTTLTLLGTQSDAIEPYRVLAELEAWAHGGGVSIVSTPISEEA